MYPPEQLVGDVFVTDTRVCNQSMLVHHLRCDTGFFFRYVHLGRRRIIDKVLVNDNMPTSVDCKTPKK